MLRRGTSDCHMSIGPWMVGRSCFCHVFWLMVYWLCLFVIVVAGYCFLLNSDNLVPVVLVVARVLAKVDGGDLEDAVAGALAVAAQRGAAPLVLGALNRGLRGLLGLGEGVRGDGAEGQEVEKGGSSDGRHVCVLIGGKVEEGRDFSSEEVLRGDF